MDKTKIKTTAVVFELPQRLGIIQRIDYVPVKQCTSNGCFYEGLLSAEGCRRGVCVKYRVWVHSQDRKTWEVRKRWRRRRDEDVGGCLRQQVADALWELSGQYDVGVWYEYRRVGMGVNQYDVFCGVVVNGVELGQPYCRTVEDCVRQILEGYKREVEKMKEPPQPALVIKYDPAEELLSEWPELEAFGTEWVRKWMPYAKERMVRIAEVLRRYSRARMIIEKVSETRENPYVIEMYIAPDGEVCIAISADVYCLSTDDKVRKVPLDYIGLLPPRGLMAFTRRKEFVRVV